MNKRPRKRNSPSSGSARSNRCENCRLRRIKCDGGRPQCANCIARRWDCPGYPAWDLCVRPLPPIAASTSSSSQPHSRTISPLHTVSPPPSTNLSQHHNMTDEVRHAFDYFRLELCARFRGRHYPISWAICSISIGLQEPAVFYAMAALSMADQALSDVIHTSLLRPIERSKREMAIRTYLKAISCLREPMRKAINGNTYLEPVILSCVNLLVYEIYTGDTLSAVRHARIGRAILDERLKSTGSMRSVASILQSASRPRQSTTVPGSASQSRQSSPAPGLLASGQSGNAQPCSRFVSLEEARSSLEPLIESAQELRERLMVLSRDFTHNLQTDKSKASLFCLEVSLSRLLLLDAHLQYELYELVRKFQDWGALFSTMFLSGDFTSRELFMLQIHFFNANFGLTMCRSQDERGTDGFAEQYARTIVSAEQLLHPDGLWSGPVAIELMQKLSMIDGELHAMEGETNDLGTRVRTTIVHDEGDREAAGIFEFGILPALYTIACKCRIPHLRQRAVKVLSESERYEAITSSQTLAVYAKAIIRLEEQAAAQVSSLPATSVNVYASEIPEQARFLDVVVSPVDEVNGSFSLTVTKAVTNGGRVRLLEYMCDNSSGDYSLLDDEIF